MNRRDFIKALGFGAAAVTFGSALASSANTLITPEWVATEATTSLAVGDIFTIAGVHAVNPITRQSTAHLQQFVITAVVGDDISISPSVTSVGHVISPSLVTPLGTHT